ncbi:alpha-1,3-mannosyl-glycoprotein 4-beta-N-acetylglucosaminyltransferase C-like isoform X2 [Patella vulgata]|nr:alpha-1,3-mannosyl-glycoprotein 4-beta-N-acetylglucosaminyltransferase C-like isoform X2 [Patella vulgata]XP_050413875.2 alpha-1,3-mannosyl-glycoprotein 4-beta-N-acetylglucosaminyltransferase C-like isoform X2 [Patella vulgata]XP_050413894.2 alpha-1,3-mannosyl-glycoprotein 4-beta-N-acetylglucosaminyltransferase C-like isoform X2 [Patella vulgata]
MKPTFVPDNDRVSTKGFLTIGIPTVQRKGAVYIFSTLESLVNNSRPKTKHAWEVKIVILFADTNKTYNDELAKNITIVYHDLIDQKVMHLVTIPGNYYPDLDHLKITYNDSTVRVKWRSKQNLDYAYLMAYSANLSQYYLQLEDDLLTREGYLDNIKEFIKEHKKHDWAMLDFNESGFIGKLYHSPDIVKLATVLKSFFNEKPCDYLISDFLKLMLQQKRYYYKPKLFRHLGLHSSLSINKRVTDHHFKR